MDRLTVRTFAFEENGYIGHYIGGYTNWQAQRQDQAAEKEIYKKKEQVQRRTKQKKLKFTYQEAKEYESIEEDIAAIEEQIAQLEEQINGCGSDFVKLTALSEEKEQLDMELLNKMDRWEYLEDLSARIEAGEMVEVE